MHKDAKILLDNALENDCEYWPEVLGTMYAKFMKWGIPQELANNLLLMYFQEELAINAALLVGEGVAN